MNTHKSPGRLVILSLLLMALLITAPAFTPTRAAVEPLPLPDKTLRNLTAPGDVLTLQGVTISGPTTGDAGIPLTFNAGVTPITIQVMG